MKKFFLGNTVSTVTGFFLIAFSLFFCLDAVSAASCNCHVKLVKDGDVCLDSTSEVTLGQPIAYGPEFSVLQCPALSFSALSFHLSNDDINAPGTFTFLDGDCDSREHTQTEGTNIIFSFTCFPEQAVPGTAPDPNATSPVTTPAQTSANGGISNGAVGNLETFELTNPIQDPTSPNKKSGITSINTLVGKVIQTMLGVLGSIALIVFMYGGFLWLTSAGAEEKVSAGLNAMLYAAVGIFVIFGSYAILNTLLTGLK